MQMKTPVGILGATGIVGQRFVQMLEHHPWFEITWLAASDRSEGRLYGEAARWRMKSPIPTRIARMCVSTAQPEDAPKIIFAALDAGIAAELESRFDEAGWPGVAQLDILGNVIPYIAKEEEKMEEETLKLLGRLNGAKVEPAAFAMSAQCNRVAVEDGHTESVSVELKEKAQREEIIAT